MNDLLSRLRAIVGEAYVQDAAGTHWAQDWTGHYPYRSLAVVRPANTAEVAAVVRLANETSTPVVPVSGNTGLCGGAQAQGALLLSVDRLNQITDIRPDARIAVVGAGAILSNVHAAAAEHGLNFPVTLGARGTAMIGGLLGTNAGGSNVLRYGNTRDLVLGIEVVLPSGEVMDLMSELHKDNSGYNLKHLLIGAEGTLGVITAAVLKLVPAPRAHATAMVAVAGLDQALVLLNRLQEASDGAVHAFEYMPQIYLDEFRRQNPETRPAFDQSHAHNIMVELGAVAPRDAVPDGDGTVPLAALLEQTLAVMFRDGSVLDAVVAQSDAQRTEMWDRREAAGEVTLANDVIINNDVALPLDKVSVFLDRAGARLHALDPEGRAMVVAHLGDGNVHYMVWPSRDDAVLKSAVMEAVEDEVLALGGSFSAEHGIGVSKLPSMARRKDPVALAAMRAIKDALDPKGIMNPGKVLPAE